ncbi:MAG: SPOR domain-containing protein [Deltaproteobacteria bacterium]|nr:SPOR domain-containing protein [Deltaproteobacteria bacterium]
MNKKSLEHREVRLGLIHVAGLLGLTVGCIAAAFCLGYLAGSKVGFERESANILTELPKFPVNDVGTEDLGEKIADEVYAKLNEQNQVSPPAAGIGETHEVPELSSIPDVIQGGSQAPEAAIDVQEAPAAVPETQVIDTSKPPVEEAPTNVKVLGDLPPQEKTGDSSISVSDAGKAPSQPEGVKSSAKSSAAPAQTLQEMKGETLQPEKEIKTAVKVEEKLPPPAVKSPAVDKPSSSIVPPAGKVPPGWFAQVAAPKKIEDANQLASSLRSSGFAVTIEAAQVRGENYFRVLVGPEGTKSQAEILLKQLKREKYIKGEPFMRLVK